MQWEQTSNEYKRAWISTESLLEVVELKSSEVKLDCDFAVLLELLSHIEELQGVRKILYTRPRKYEMSDLSMTIICDGADIRM